MEVETEVETEVEAEVEPGGGVCKNLKKTEKN